MRKCQRMPDTTADYVESCPIKPVSFGVNQPIAVNLQHRKIKMSFKCVAELGFTSVLQGEDPYPGTGEMGRKIVVSDRSSF